MYLAAVLTQPSESGTQASPGADPNRGRSAVHPQTSVPVGPPRVRLPTSERPLPRQGAVAATSHSPTPQPAVASPDGNAAPRAAGSLAPAEKLRALPPAIPLATGHRRRRHPPHVPVTIRGHRELWNFNGETPSAYAVQQALVASAGGMAGTFQWTIPRGSAIADFNGASTAAGPSVTLKSKLGSTVRRDVHIRVDFTGAGGRTGHATRRFTVRKPKRVVFLRNSDGPDSVYVYLTKIHKRPVDQFGTSLPRGVEVNEQFTAAPTADFPGMDWRPSINRGGFITPPAWLFDLVGGETPAHTPTPVLATHSAAGVKVNHWPGVWRIGSMVIGRGVQVASVVWQKFRGKGRHV
jgi:hypothetical protein